MSMHRVLVVEDDHATQNLLKTLLGRDGFEPMIVSNGAEALKAIEENDFAVIVLDLMMPKVSGHDVIDVLRQRPSRPSIVICTAAGTTAEAFEPGMVSAVIRKPFDIEELSAAVLAAANRPA